MRHSQPWLHRVSHPHAPVCIACSTRSPARNTWRDTSSLRLPRVCCPQPGTPSAAPVCTACATRDWACNVCSTRSICSQIGTRTLCLPRVWYPEPLPALCIDTCSLRLHRVLSCGTWLQRVQHPQALACTVWTPAHGSRWLTFTQPWWSCSHWETACSALACLSAKSNGWVPPSAMATTCCLSPNPGGAAHTGDCLQCTCMLKCQIQWVGASVCHGHNVLSLTQPWWSCSHRRLLAVRLNAEMPNPMGGCLCPPWPQHVSHPQTPVCIVWSTRSPGPAPCAAPAAIAHTWHLHATSALCVIRPCITPAAQACTVWPSGSSWLQRVQYLQTPACIVWTPAHGATSGLLLSLWTCDAYLGQDCLTNGQWLLVVH